MRLLPTSPQVPLDQMLECIGSSVPRYAILSHTWGPDEVTLRELDSPSISTSTKKGFEKIRRTCDLARVRDSLEYAWVDTCCIDKTSSAELTEAINSMFAWYARADVCYAYLSDLDPGTDEDLEAQLPQCRWFTRGWTLQELIAPRDVVFFDCEWNERGNKHTLCHLICGITRIPVNLLERKTTLEKYAVARRMSWAATRETTRVEDTAYCLLGIFGVHLSLIYGEGSKAFYRLQEAIVLSSVDLSIFVWVENRPNAPSRLLAPILADAPVQFADCGKIEATLEDSIYRDLAINPRGFQVEGSLIKFPEHDDDAYKCLLDPFCADNGNSIAIALRKIGGGRYARYKPAHRAYLSKDYRTSRWLDINRMLVESLTLAAKIPDHFPFPGPDAVLGNRHCALRVQWRDTDPAYVFSQQFRPQPRSHWDVHDEIFFSASSISKSWCALFVRGILTGPAGGIRIPVHFFVSCHSWNVKTPKVIVVGLHDLQPPTAVLLETQLDRIRFESNCEAEALILSVFDSDIPAILWANKSVHSAKALLTTAVLKSDIAPFAVAASEDAIHSRLRNTEDKIAVEVTAHIHQETCPELCSLPMWRLDIGCKVLPGLDA